MADPTFVEGIVLGIIIAIIYHDMRSIWLRARKEKQHA